jgi:hypothetical protein
MENEEWKMENYVSIFLLLLIHEDKGLQRNKENIIFSAKFFSSLILCGK